MYAMVLSKDNFSSHLSDVPRLFYLAETEHLDLTTSIISFLKHVKVELLRNLITLKLAAYSTLC